MQHLKKMFRLGKPRKINHYENCRLVITDENSTVIGWAALSPVSKRPCFSGVAEVSIYLANAVKGQGLGTLLLRRLVNESEENGFGPCNPVFSLKTWQA